MTSSRRISALLSTLAVAAILATPAIAQDKAKPAAAADKAMGAPAKSPNPEITQVYLDNDKVRVTETRYKPGQASSMRERGNRVTRALTDGTLERTYADGKKETINWKAGDVKYSTKATFINKNVGKAEMVLYTVTLK